MPTTPGDAPIDVPPQELIANLAKLYDRFAQALDPYSPECDEAERAFLRELSVWYDDSLSPPKPSFHEFRKGIIIRCRKHLRATTKLPSV
jgi:hypothetical protein